GPEIFCGESFAEFDPAEKLAERCGDGDVFDGIEAEEDDGALDGGDLPGQAVKGGVDDFENAGDEGRIVSDDFVQVRGSALGVFDGGDNFGSDFRECGNRADLLDHFKNGRRLSFDDTGG